MFMEWNGPVYAGLGKHDITMIQAFTQGRMSVGAHTIAAIDAQGLVFAVGTHDQKIRLYGLNGHDRIPFCTFELSQTENADWTGIQFTSDGKYMLVSTRNEAHLLVDAFDVCGLTAIIQLAISRPRELRAHGRISCKPRSLAHLTPRLAASLGVMTIACQSLMCSPLTIQGKLVQTYRGHANTSGMPLVAQLSPDSDYVVSGT